ncbi:outer dynein arm-docking complex subunit 4-like [Anthonomus grandis grandis]|uniref:outer dynein arm-docking complex subunit 4-like n=1 Tax=Anthonomus grandis grandis TaxID=2921223 RepID=UPI00216548AA|nr:outer dynein arm-docking complex subunit 4-like [Anthonomus grandis grandis]
MDDLSKFSAENRLNITREAELLQSFVRVNVKDDSNEEENRSEEALGRETSPEVENRFRQAPMSAETSRKLSKQITEDVQKRKGKRRRKKTAIRQEEVYCDKDRAAAVNMGSKDIKQSLKIKRKEERSKILQIPEEAEPGNFLALGNYGMCRGDLQIAIDFMSKALELNPSEKNSLVARSKCYILLGQPENALRDAETALQVDKTFIKAIFQKAEALYYLGDFEHALMYYHRGLHIRPDHHSFKMGVQKSQQAIENAIGSFMSSKRASSSKGGRHSKETSTRVTPALSNRRSTPSGVKGKPKPSKLLRELAADKDYLDDLMNNPDINCKFKENDDSIRKCIQETVDYLNARQEFWRQQLPKHLK